MSIKHKILDFVNRNGFTYRSFALSIVLFPPAALYIACKKPGASLSHRIALNLIVIVSVPLLTVMTGVMIREAVRIVYL